MAALLLLHAACCYCCTHGILHHLLGIADLVLVFVLALQLCHAVVLLLHGRLEDAGNACRVMSEPGGGR